MILSVFACRFLHYVFSTPSSSKPLPFFACKALSLPSSAFTSSALEVPFGANQTLDHQIHETALDVFRRCGCSDDDISKILFRQPLLLQANTTTLQYMLNLLQNLGFVGSDLVKMIKFCPRFLCVPITDDLDKRLQFLKTLFQSQETLRRAIIRNPYLLNYDIESQLKPCVALYEEMGINREQLGFMLNSRPLILSRSSLDKEKLAYIQATGVPKDSKMYKYVVSLLAVSRLETIHGKVTNLEKYGFSFEDVMRFFGRTPNVLTLSIDKVRRNMTYIIGTMKLPACTVLDYPLLLYLNLDTVLKPRFLLARKIEEMGLQPQIKGSIMMTALKMSEPQLVRKFISCHNDDVAKILMEFYSHAKSIKRLAQNSKLCVRKGFPF
ncbi:hypothetical protein ACLOJK_013000 [Asimina triloba]